MSSEEELQYKPPRVPKNNKNPKTALTSSSSKPRSSSSGPVYPVQRQVEDISNAQVSFKNNFIFLMIFKIWFKIEN